ncbi:MerR family transcriptional regulator [Enterococcus faecalis]|nr:MerR family transcriptional regulator [Enterococcus faecalis]
MGKFLLNVGQASKITKLSKSKIRYWDDMNLLTSSRNSENGYREFHLEDILTIKDIDFYRKLDIPIHKITNLYRKSPEELWNMLDETETKVSEELIKLDTKKQEIKHRKDQLLSLIELKEKEFLDEPIDIEKIIPIDLQNPIELQTYMDTPYNLAVYIDSKNNKKISYGFAVTAKEFVGEASIWQQSSPKEYKYKQFLFIIRSDVTLENNFQSIKKKLKKQGYQIGTMVGRYIMTAEDLDGFYKDYFKAWVEVNK